ncbi:MAG TPA: aldo/keto reductase [Candidatus Dormibacteraeota bacterium]|nr:aldo/keto reductase [Candidatus Dormibacteraeota bacterium]
MKLAGVEIARIGLGTNRLTNTPANVRFIKAAVDAGVQLIDTAHLYTGGKSEETIGEALSPPHDGVVIATKGGVNGGAPDVIRAEIQESLRKLRAKRIDLYYLHRVDANVRLEDSLGAIKESVDDGVIGAVGLSQVGVEQIERARRIVPVAVVQNMYNLGERQNDPVVDYCTREGIPFVAFYPLHGVEGGRAEEIARRLHATTHQIALAWLLKRSPVMLAIPGTLSLGHLQENLAAQKLELTDKDFEALR